MLQKEREKKSSPKMDFCYFPTFWGEEGGKKNNNKNLGGGTFMGMYKKNAEELNQPCSISRLSLKRKLKIFLRRKKTNHVSRLGLSFSLSPRYKVKT